MSRSCPRCQIGCVEQTVEGVAIDICPTCRGVFLDASEFDALVAQRISDTPLESLFAFMADDVDNPLACSGCGDSMQRLDYESLEIDRCAHCGAIWIDGAERGEFTKMSRTKAAQPSTAPEESVECGGCHDVVPRRQCIRRFDEWWCEQCVVEGNHPGPEAQLVGQKQRIAAAAAAYATARADQAVRRTALADRKARHERRNRSYFQRRLFFEWHLMEDVMHWFMDKLGR